MCAEMQLKYTVYFLYNQTFELVQGYDCVTVDIHYKQPGKGTYLLWVLDNDHELLMYTFILR